MREYTVRELVRLFGRSHSVVQTAVGRLGFGRLRNITSGQYTYRLLSWAEAEQLRVLFLGRQTKQEEDRRRREMKAVTVPEPAPKPNRRPKMRQYSNLEG